jgi:hypothetical protein
LRFLYACGGQMPKRSFYMKKLLLVMLVPVLVLGFIGCGKLVEGNAVDLLAGTWSDGTTTLIIAGNQASISIDGDVDKDGKQIIAKFRIDSSYNKDTTEGKISFNSFDDKKAKELGSVKFTGDLEGSDITFSEAASDTDNHYVKSLVGDFSR